MRTKETYYEQDYREEWSTRILDIEKSEKGYGIILEESAFYPGGGGQPWDLGTINGARILNIYREGDKILHLVEELPQERETALCCIDRERRLDLMQQHSGQHLLSAVFYTLYNGQTSSFHLGLDYVTIDISIPNLSEDVIKKVEDQANQYIYQDIKIKHYLVDQEELERLPLRKRPKVDKNIRIVEIEGVDWSPCGGTHLDSTGSLGIIKIIKTENYKGNTRVYFKTGRRALEDYQKKISIVDYLTSLLSASEDEIRERVEKELSKGRNLSKELNGWKEKCAYWESKDILAHNEPPIISALFEDKDFEEIERLSRELLMQGEYIILFASKKEKRILLSHSGHAPIHCGKLFREHLPQLEGRGGGNDTKAQAAFASIEHLEQFYNLIAGKIV